MKEEYLLTGPIEPTNRPYALAKIAGVKMCCSYNRQYGARHLAVMPTNLYGEGDNNNLNLQYSHLLPALIRKFHEPKGSGAPSVKVWRAGNPKREFLNSDDMADACTCLMDLPSERFDTLLGSDEASTGIFMPLVNVGDDEYLTIAGLAGPVRNVAQYKGAIEFDTSMPDGTPCMLLDVSRLSALGWKAGIALPEGLSNAYEAFKIAGTGRGS